MATAPLTGKVDGENGIGNETRRSDVRPACQRHCPRASSSTQVDTLGSDQLIFAELRSHRSSRNLHPSLFLRELAFQGDSIATRIRKT